MKGNKTLGGYILIVKGERRKIKMKKILLLFAALFIITVPTYRYAAQRVRNTR